MLELQNISYGVEQDGDSKNILRDISLTIDERFGGERAGRRGSQRDERVGAGWGECEFRDPRRH